MANLFEELQKAIGRSDIDEMNRIRKLILDGVRDDSSDKKLMTSLKGKQIYKNIVYLCDGSKVVTMSELVKMVSSLITHTVIECDMDGTELINSSVNELYVILGELINGGDGSIDSAERFIKDRYGKFVL